jgi:hypothetical protein
VVSGRRLRNVHQRNRLWLASGGRCRRCGLDLPPDWHADHVVPWHVCRETRPENMQALCPACNLRKGGRMSAESSVIARALELIAQVRCHEPLLRKFQREFLQIIERVLTGTHDWKAPRTLVAEVFPGGGKSYLAVLSSLVRVCG